MAVITPVDLIVLAIGVAVLAAWLALFFRGRKNDWMFEQLNDKDYPVKENTEIPPSGAPFVPHAPTPEASSSPAAPSAQPVPTPPAAAPAPPAAASAPAPEPKAQPAP